MKNLRKLREIHGMSQQKLAEELFVTQQSIYKYENDLAYPTLDTLKLMSKIFSVSIDYIVENESPEHPFIDSELIPSKDEQELLSYYRRLSPNLRKTINTLLKQMQ